MDENERKRKRDAGEDDDAEISDLEGKEAPLEGLKLPQKNKKQKIEGEVKAGKESGERTEEQKIKDAEKRREKRARQAEKKKSDKEKDKVKQKKRKEKLKPLIKAAKEAKKAEAAQINGDTKDADNDGAESEAEENDEDADVEMADSSAPKPKPTAASKSKKVIKEVDIDDSQSEASSSSDEEDERHEPVSINGLDKMDLSGLAEPVQASPEISPTPDSTFSPALEHQAASSSSSLDDTTSTTKPTISTKSLLKSTALTALEEPKESKEVLRARLEAKINALKAARKAIDSDGQPIRTRQELIEHRRVTELERKAKKKKQREADFATDEKAQKAKAEAELAKLRGTASSPITSGSRSGSVFSPVAPAIPKPSLDGIAYSRVAFADGDLMRATSGLSKPREKGSIDPKSALAKAEAHAARLASLDDATRADIESKELWQRARQRVSGEKVKDDVSLLKKTLKRKEKAKLKSETAWNERKDNVAKGQEIRQKKREGNLQQRKDEKGGKKLKKKGGAKSLNDKQKAKRAKNKAFG
jgi:hypothetical protein